MPDESSEQARITSEDVDAVTNRLNELMPTLPDQERLVVGWILTRAAAAQDESVHEFAERTQGGVPVSELMADAVGLGDVRGYASGSPIDPVITGDGVGIKGIKWFFRW